jgi:hypothetical protein
MATVTSLIEGDEFFLQSGLLITAWVDEVPMQFAALPDKRGAWHVHWEGNLVAILSSKRQVLDYLEGLERMPDPSSPSVTSPVTMPKQRRQTSTRR